MINTVSQTIQSQFIGLNKNFRGHLQSDFLSQSNAIWSFGVGGAGEGEGVELKKTNDLE